jgi:hypothetical protein
MYRFVSSNESDPIRSISSLVSQEYPGIFEPINGVKPHVSILPRNTVLSFLKFKRACVDNPYKTARQLYSEVYRDLQPLALDPVKASRADFKYVGKSLAIVLGSPQVSSEIDYAYGALEQIVGMGIDRETSPHITIGRLASMPRPELSDRILGSAEDICGTYLPKDMVMTLGAISLHRP